MSRTLRQLLAALPGEQIISTHGDLSTVVSAPVVESSQDVQPGGLFVARMGEASDGHDYIPAAIQSGAVAIVGEKPLTHLPLPYIRVHDAQGAIGNLAAAFHAFPARELIIIGVTGTDGKTTTCHLLHSILKHAGIRAGFISTIAADFGHESAATGLHVTTPGAPRIQASLAQMLRAGLTHCILEMTSHGLAQGRLNGVDIDIALLTNVMHEHLDYHGSWERYRDAKAIMFRLLGDSARIGDVRKTAVINADDASAGYFAAIPSDATITYGLRDAADYRACRIRNSPSGSDFAVLGQPIRLTLPGEFNVLNALAAISAARALDIAWADIAAGLAAVTGLSGRMERIDLGQDFGAMVDFAHTPNALRRALIAGRKMLKPGKRLIAVFGSAGLRDVQKRRLMAEVAAELADLTILTAEDPRTESLDAILEMMAQGCLARGGVEGESFLRVPDRGDAIFQACQLAGAGDLVMACGKGHEQSMCFGATEYPWDDREALRSALRGAPLATLPTAGDHRLARD